MIKFFKLGSNLCRLWIDYPKFGDVHFSLIPNLSVNYKKWPSFKQGSWSRKVEKGQFGIVLRLLFFNIEFDMSITV